MFDVRSLTFELLCLPGKVISEISIINFNNQRSSANGSMIRTGGAGSCQVGTLNIENCWLIIEHFLYSFSLTGVPRRSLTAR